MRSVLVFWTSGQVEVANGEPRFFEGGCQCTELVKEVLGKTMVRGAIDVGDSEHMFRGGGAEGEGEGVLFCNRAGGS